jgi:hypothetical protein
VIEKLRERDKATLTAIGPKFDLEKVLATGRSLLMALFGRSSMRFPDEPTPTIELEADQRTLLDGMAVGMVVDMFREFGQEAFDAADLHVYLSFGPYLATWAPFGISALHGPIGNCTTIFDEPWEQIDVTPTILLMCREKPYQAMGRPATKLAAETLRADPRGTELTFSPHDVDAEVVLIRFPHDAFGVGRETIRICRYLDEDGAVTLGEEDGS